MERYRLQLGMTGRFAAIVLMVVAAAGYIAGQAGLLKYVEHMPFGYVVYYLLPALLCVAFAVLLWKGARENVRLLLIPTVLLILWEVSAALELQIGEDWLWIWRSMEPFYKVQSIVNLLLIVLPEIVFCLAVCGVLKKGVACGIILAFCGLWCVAIYVIFPLCAPVEVSLFALQTLLYTLYRLCCYFAFVRVILSLEAVPVTERETGGSGWPVKSIAACILLSIITCGIYQLFWAYSLCKSIRRLSGEPETCVGEFLCLTFVPFYGLYWMYTRGEKIARGAAARGVTVQNTGTICLVLWLFGLGIVSYALVQNTLNSLVGVMQLPPVDRQGYM